MATRSEWRATILYGAWCRLSFFTCILIVFASTDEYSQWLLLFSTVCSKCSMVTRSVEANQGGSSYMAPDADHPFFTRPSYDPSPPPLQFMIWPTKSVRASRRLIQKLTKRSLAELWDLKLKLKKKYQAFMWWMIQNCWYVKQMPTADTPGVKRMRRWWRVGVGRGKEQTLISEFIQGQFFLINCSTHHPQSTSNLSCLIFNENTTQHQFCYLCCYGTTFKLKIDHREGAFHFCWEQNKFS